MGNLNLYLLIYVMYLKKEKKFCNQNFLGLDDLKLYILIQKINDVKFKYF